MTVHAMPDRSTVRGQVAGQVRAELGRNKITVNRLPGIPGSIHRCRHTYATELLRGGENIRVVQTLLRHERLSSTEMYTAVDEAERRAAINRLPAA